MWTTWIVNGMDKTKDAELRVRESAITLFAEKGYDGTSIREIIEHAGVTRPVLYYYFENKEDLFCQVVESSFDEFASFMDSVLESTKGCRERLRKIMCYAFQVTEQSPQLVRLVLQVFFSPPQEGPKLNRDRMIWQRFTRLITIMRAGLSSGELSGNSPEELALSFAGLMDIHLILKSHKPIIPLTPSHGEWLVDLFMEGARHAPAATSGFNRMITEALDSGTLKKATV